MDGVECSSNEGAGFSAGRSVPGSAADEGPCGGGDLGVVYSLDVSRDAGCGTTPLVVVAVVAMMRRAEIEIMTLTTISLDRVRSSEQVRVLN